MDALKLAGHFVALELRIERLESRFDKLAKVLGDTIQNLDALGKETLKLADTIERNPR